MSRNSNRRENMKTRNYSGPVVYIVHGPEPGEIRYTTNAEQIAKLGEANRAKILETLESAATRNIPVVYEYLLGDQTRNMAFAQRAKRKPEIIWVETNQGLKDKLAAGGITPTKFLLIGHYRDKCVREAAQALKKSFPQTGVHLIEGAHTFYSGNLGRDYDYRAELRGIGVKFSKKLNPKHWA